MHYSKIDKNKSQMVLVESVEWNIFDNEFGFLQNLR